MNALIFVALLAGQPSGLDRVEIKAHKVAGSVYMLEGAGGNIGVSVGEDGIVLVDDQFAPLAPKIEAALRKITKKPIRFVLNTHWHGDHTGGNEKLGAKATIVAHENVRKRMKEGRPAKVEPAPKVALPVITFDERLTIHLNGEEIRALHYPKGHTDGDSVIYFTNSNVVHMGDDFVTYGFPFIDVSSGGTVSGFVANLDRIIAEIPPDAKIIPGHGPISTVADVKKFAATLKEIVAAVEAGVKKGKSLDALKKERVLAKWEPAWGGSFVKSDQFLTTVYLDLTSRR